jgi:hypothetical protein
MGAVAGLVPGAEALGAAVGAEQATIGIEQALVDTAGWYEVWMGKVPLAERVSLLREAMVNTGVSEGWLAKFDAAGEKMLRRGRTSVMEQMGKGLKVAQREAFEAHWDMARRFPKGITAKAHDNFAKQVIGRLKKVPGVPKEFVDDIARLPVATFRRMGPVTALSTLENARPETIPGKIWRWAFQGTEAAKAPPHIGVETRNVLAQLQGETVKKVPTGAKTKLGKAKQFAQKAQMRVAGGPRPPVSGEAVKGFREAGVRGFSRGARAAGKLGGLGPILGTGFVGLEAMDAAIGGQVRAREAYEAWSQGQGMVNPSESLLRDFLGKRDNIARRRAMLQRDPELLQKVVQAIAGSTPQSPYTDSEISIGASAGAPARKQLGPDEMDAILNKFLEGLGEA